MDMTAAQYAQQQGVSISTARKHLTEMVDIGRAQVSYNVIIDQRSMKRGARSRIVPVRGHLYHINHRANLLAIEQCSTCHADLEESQIGMCGDCQPQEETGTE
ncbi:hypothetical protein ACEN2T_17700 [Pseudomonas sp. W22_MBD1_FP4]|uniref:hypothetical protein n=1 Tax=Pseudomonas sp. W22_MBD1_FP4 TaxID=3240272 RepID=UPI003F960667